VRVLFLGPDTSPIYRWLNSVADVMWHLGGPFPVVDRIISHGHRLRVSKKIALRQPIYNCHISFLPWNRGSNPNFWAWVDGTPHGVTIHQMDAGIDTGPIISQRCVDFDPHPFGHTLCTTYDLLQREMLRLFAETWQMYPDWDALPRNPQIPGAGSYHTAVDFDALIKRAPQLFAKGWDTPVQRLIEYREEAATMDSPYANRMLEAKE
jgi:hypothetical protein